MYAPIQPQLRAQINFFLSQPVSLRESRTVTEYGLKQQCQKGEPFWFEFSHPFTAVTKSQRLQCKDGFLLSHQTGRLHCCWVQGEAGYNGREHIIGQSYLPHGSQEEKREKDRQGRGGGRESERGIENAEEEGSERGYVLPGHTPMAKPSTEESWMGDTPHSNHNTSIEATRRQFLPFQCVVKLGSWHCGSHSGTLSSERSLCSISVKRPGVKPTLVGGPNPINLWICFSCCCRKPHPASFDTSHSWIEILPLLWQPICKAILASLF